MAEPFLAEIRLMSSIQQNQALFSLLGTTYGGDGRVTFGLPNLQGIAYFVRLFVRTVSLQRHLIDTSLCSELRQGKAIAMCWKKLRGRYV